MKTVNKFLGAAAFIGAFALARHGDDFLRRMDFDWLVHNPTASGRIGGPIADAIPKAAENCPSDGRPVRRIELTPEQAEIIFGPPSERQQAEPVPAASGKCRPRKVITLTPEEWKAFMSPEDWERAFGTKSAEPQETKPSASVANADPLLLQQRLDEAVVGSELRVAYFEKLAFGGATWVSTVLIYGYPDNATACQSILRAAEAENPGSQFRCRTVD